jgi:group I intron endonuclease
MLIYSLTNLINGKVYIGQTTHYKLSERWSARLDTSKANLHLRRAINKYGSASFDRKVLCYASCQEELDLLETFFICVFKSTDRRYGYNKATGGNGGRTFNTEMRKAISQTMKDVWRFRSRQKHAEAIRSWWAGLSKGEQKLLKLRQSLALTPAWNRGMKLPPAWNKGKKLGPFTKIHKDRIASALRRFHREKRKQWKRFLRERRKQMRRPTKDQIQRQLQIQVKDIIDDAVRALEQNQSTRLARSQLREIERRLKLLEFEFKGGCSW